MLDLSFLTEEEQEAIMKVLQRDADLKKAEDERVRTLEETIDDTNEFKNKSGQWFYEAKSKRHRDKIHGADLIRASIRKKKPQTLAELSQSRNDKTKKSWVSNVNKDFFIPPELVGVMEEPEKENEEEKTRVQLYRSAPRVDSLALSENDSSVVKAVSSPSKQRKNPFNDPSLENNFELPIENHISQNGAPNVYETPENDMLVPSQKSQDNKTMPTVEFNEVHDISTVAGVEVRNEKPAPKPKARTVTYKISDLQSDSDSSPTKPAKKNDSMNGTGARRGILKRTPSSSSTDSEILRVSMDAPSKPVPPASPILEGEVEKSPFGDQMEDSSQNSLDRLKQVRFTSVEPQTLDAQNGREIGEFDLLESDYAQNSTNGNEGFKHKDNDLQSFQRPVPVHSKIEKLDSDLPVPVSAGETADASLEVTLPSFSSNLDNNLKLSDGPKTELVPNSYATSVQSLPEDSELLQERGTSAEDTKVRRPNGISVNILENGAPTIGNNLNKLSADLSDNELQTSKLMIDQQPIYAKIKSPRVSKLDPVDITQGNSSDESEPSGKTETVLVDPNLPKYDDQRDRSKVSLHAHQLQSNANVPVNEELRISKTIRGKAEGQIQYPISTEKINGISKSHREDILEIIDKTDVSPKTKFDAFKTALEQLHQESQDQHFTPNHKTVNLSIKKASHAEGQLQYSSVSPNYIEGGEKLPGARVGACEKSPSQPTEEQLICPKRTVTQASPQEVIKKSIALPTVNLDEFNTKVERLHVESSMMSPVLHVGIAKVQTPVSTAGEVNRLAFPNEEAFDSAEKIVPTPENRQTEYNAEMNGMLKKPSLPSQSEAQKQQMSTPSLVEEVPNKEVNEVISKTVCPPRSGPDEFNINLKKLLLEESVPITSVYQTTSVVVKLNEKPVMEHQNAHELPTTDLQDEAVVYGEVKPTLEKLPQWSSSTTQVKINLNDPKGKTLPKEVDEVILKTSVTRKADLHNFDNGLEKPIMETSKLSHIVQRRPDDGNNLSLSSIGEEQRMSQGENTVRGVAQLVVGRSEQNIDIIQQQNRQLVQLSNRPSIDKMSSGISGELLQKTVLNEVAISSIIPSNVTAQEVSTGLQEDDNPVPVSTVRVLQKTLVEIKSPEHPPSPHQILRVLPSPSVMAASIELPSTPLNSDVSTEQDVMMHQKSLVHETAPVKPEVQVPVQDMKEVVKMVSPKADLSKSNHDLKTLTIEYSSSPSHHQDESEQDTIQVDKSTQHMQSYTKFPVEEPMEGTAALKSEPVEFTAGVENLKKKSLMSSSTVYVKSADMVKTTEHFITAEENHNEQPGKEPSTDGKIAASPTEDSELHLQMSEKLDKSSSPVQDRKLEEKKTSRISRKDNQPQEVGKVIGKTVVPSETEINKLKISLPNVQEEAAKTPVDEKLLDKDPTLGEPEKVLHEEVKEVVVKTVSPKPDLSELNSGLRRLMMEASHSIPLKPEVCAQDTIQQIRSNPQEQSLPKFPAEAIVERTAALKSEPLEFRAGLQKLKTESMISTSTTYVKPTEAFKAPQNPTEEKHIEHPEREISTITEIGAPLNKSREVNLQMNKQLNESSPLHHRTMEEQKISRFSIKEDPPQEAGEVIVKTVPQKTEFSEFKIGLPKLQKEAAKSPMVQKLLVNDTTRGEPDEKVLHQDVNELVVKMVSPQADLKEFNSGLRKLTMEASLSVPPNPERLAQEPIQEVTSTYQEHSSPEFLEEEIVERVTAPKSELIEYKAGLEKLKRESMMSKSTISLNHADLGKTPEDSTPAEESHIEIYDPPNNVHSVLNTQIRKQLNDPNFSRHHMQLEEQKVSIPSVEEDHAKEKVVITKMGPAKTELNELQIGKPSLQEVESTTPMTVLQKTPGVIKMEEGHYSPHQIPIQRPRPEVLQSEGKSYIPPKADIGESYLDMEAAVYQNTLENKTTLREPKENVLPQEVKEVVVKKALPKSELYEFKSGLRKLAVEAAQATPVHENDQDSIREVNSTPVEQRPPAFPKAELVETVMARNEFLETNAALEKQKKEPIAWTPAVHEKTSDVVQTPVYSTPAEFRRVEHPTKVITTIVKKIDASSANDHDETTLVSGQSPQDLMGKLCTDENQTPEVRAINVKTAVPAKVELSELKIGLKKLQSEESEPQISLLQKNSVVVKSRTYSVPQSISEGPRKVAVGAPDGTIIPPTADLCESHSVPEQTGRIVPLQEGEEVIGKTDVQKADPQQFNVALRNLFESSLSVPSHEHVDQANARKVSKEQKLLENKGIVKMIAVPPNAELVKFIAGPENTQRVTATTTRSVLPEASRVVKVPEKYCIQEDRIHTEGSREEDVDIVEKTTVPSKLKDRNAHESLKVLHKEPFTLMHDQLREEKSSVESTKKEILSQDLNKVVLKTTVPMKSDVIKSTQKLYMETSEPLLLERKVVVVNESVNKTLQRPLKADLQETLEEPSSNQLLAQNKEEYSKMKIGVNVQNMESSLPRSLTMEEEQPVKVLKKEAAPQEVKEIVVKKTVRPKIGKNDFNIGLKKLHDEASMPSVAVLQKATTEINLQRKDSSNEPKYIAQQVVLAASSAPAFPTGLPTMSDTLQENNFEPLKDKTPIQDIPEVAVKTVTPKADLYELNARLMKLHLEASGPAPEHKLSSWQARIDDDDSKLRKQNLLEYPKEVLVEKTTAHPKTVSVEYQTGLEKLQREALMSTSALCGKGDEGPRTREENGMHKKSNLITYPPHVVQEPAQPNIESSQLSAYLNNVPFNTIEAPRTLNLVKEEALSPEVRPVIVSTVEPQKGSLTEFQMTLQKLQKRVSKPLFPVLQNSTLVKIQEKDSTKPQIHFEPPKKEIVKTMEETSPASTLYRDVNVDQDHPMDTTSPVLFMSPELKTSLERPFDRALHQETQKVTVRTVTMPKVEMVKLGKHFTESSESPPAGEKVISKVKIQPKKPPQLLSTKEAASTGESATASPSVDIRPASTSSWNFHGGQRNKFAVERHFKPDLEAPHEPLTKHSNDVTSGLMKTDTITLNELSETVNKVTLPPKTDSQEVNIGLEKTINSSYPLNETTRKQISSAHSEEPSSQEEEVVLARTVSSTRSGPTQESKSLESLATKPTRIPIRQGTGNVAKIQRMLSAQKPFTESMDHRRRSSNASEPVQEAFSKPVLKKYNVGLSKRSKESFERSSTLGTAAFNHDDVHSTSKNNQPGRLKMGSEHTKEASTNEFGQQRRSVKLQLQHNNADEQYGKSDVLVNEETMVQRVVGPKNEVSKFHIGFEKVHMNSFAAGMKLAQPTDNLQQEKLEMKLPLDPTIDSSQKITFPRSDESNSRDVQRKVSMKDLQLASMPQYQTENPLPTAVGETVNVNTTKPGMMSPIGFEKLQLDASNTKPMLRNMKGDGVGSSENTDQGQKQNAEQMPSELKDSRQGTEKTGQRRRSIKYIQLQYGGSDSSSISKEKVEMNEKTNSMPKTQLMEPKTEYVNILVPSTVFPETTSNKDEHFQQLQSKLSTKNIQIHPSASTRSQQEISRAPEVLQTMARTRVIEEKIDPVAISQSENFMPVDHLVDLSQPNYAPAVDWIPQVGAQNKKDAEFTSKGQVGYKAATSQFNEQKLKPVHDAALNNVALVITPLQTTEKYRGEIRSVEPEQSESIGVTIAHPERAQKVSTSTVRISRTPIANDQITLVKKSSVELHLVTPSDKEHLSTRFGFTRHTGKMSSYERASRESPSGHL